MRLSLVALAAISCGGPRYHLTGPVVHDIPAPPPPASRGPGPLSTQGKVAETPWPERHKLMARADHTYLDRDAIREDVAAYMKLVTVLFPDPTASELEVGVAQAKNETALLEKLAPYALDSVSNAFVGLYGRLPLCARPPGEMWHCFPDQPPVPLTTDAFQLGEAAPGVTLWTIHSFDRPGEWAAAFARVSSAKALVIDLREAAGIDPGPIIPWLERITGRAPFKPLREIRRDASLDAYVADYAARYTVEQRDRDTWASLVGEMPAATNQMKHPPIAVLVGMRCGPVCELVARSLVTYAGATLYGGTGAIGRLDRDEPARMVLPHSKVEVYFLATEYLLAADIEQATGPTSEWHLRLQDNANDDTIKFAAHELTSGPAKRCSDYPAYDTAAALPPAVQAKLPGANWLTSCPQDMDLRITLQATAPLSALERFAQTCKAPIQFSSYTAINLSVPAKSLPALSQLAQSDLVTRIDVDCEGRPETNSID